MKEYIFLFRGGRMREIYPTKEEQETYMGQWREWLKKLTDQKVFVGGKPIANEGKEVSKGGAVADFEPVSNDKLLGGYLIVKAASLDEAVNIAKGSPMLDVEGVVEVRETLKM